jgi:hypothetical protein
MPSLSATPLRFTTVLLALLTGLTLMAGCDALEVDNPNSLVEEDLGNPTASPAIANGALTTLTQGIGTVLGPYSAATDELTWTGTRDAWEQLVFGDVTDPLNEFSDAAFGAIAEARWTADAAIQRLEGFRDEGRLPSTRPLIRSYVYGALAYITIADVYENFALSNRQEAAQPVGEENMDTLYQTAIDYLDRAVTLAQNADDATWEMRALAVRARAHYGLALWAKLHPLDVDAPLVQSDAAVADAQAVLGRVSTTDWRYELEVTPNTPENDVAFQVNERLELRIGDTYIVPTGEGNRVERIRLEDPIDDVPAPYLQSAITSFVDAGQYADLPVVSAREMHLILAEDALARNDTPAFETHINDLRALDGLTPYTGQLPTEELLRHSRQVNLFLQGRRLADHYRFETPSPTWNNATPGAFFPITITEIRANPYIELDA